MIARHINTLLLDFDKTIGFMKTPHLEMYCEIAIGTGLEIDADYLLSRLKATPLGDAWAEWRTSEGVTHREESKDEESYRILRASIAEKRIRAAIVEHLDGGVTEIIREASMKIAVAESEPNRYAIYDEVREFLIQIKSENILVALVSNHDWNLSQITDDLGLSPYLDAVVTSARVGVRKPHQEMFLHAMRALAATPESSLMVGDSLEDDVQGANALGISSVLIDRNGTQDLDTGNRKIESLVDLWGEAQDECKQ